jgi:disulfide bond formation protein DsbB
MRFNLFHKTFLVLSFLLLIACGGTGNSEESKTDLDEEIISKKLSDQPSSQTTHKSTEDRLVDGEVDFMGYCSSCHGMDAKGIDGLGKDLSEGTFIKDNSNEELLKFIIKGRSSGDKENTTGIDMPPKGGNPALTDENILSIIAYLKSIQE